MSSNTSIADFMSSAETLLVAGEANAPDLAGMEDIRAGLEGAWQGAKGAISRQASLKGQAQQATRDLEENLFRGREMAARLRRGLQMRYGTRSEKLAEFGLQPLRRPQRKPAAPPPPPVEDKKPSEPGPNPAQTAAPVTDAST